LLNFGNPYDPHVYWQFANSIMGMKLACEALNTPVTGVMLAFTIKQFLTIALNHVFLHLLLV